MRDTFTHEIELYSFESFQTLLNHEILRSRRYKSPLSLIHLAIVTNPERPDITHSAEMFTINILDVQLRDTDVPCRRGKEFLVLMPATDEAGGRVVCERMARLLNVPHQTYDRVSFHMNVYVGMASLSGGASLSVETLLSQAASAMRHAFDNQLATAVSYSEIQNKNKE